jgi:hypothetical protein
MLHETTLRASKQRENGSDGLEPAVSYRRGEIAQGSNALAPDGCEAGEVVPGDVSEDVDDELRRDLDVGIVEL